jgi:hypothetical protein
MKIFLAFLKSFHAYENRQKDGEGSRKGCERPWKGIDMYSDLSKTQ